MREGGMDKIHTRLKINLIQYQILVLDISIIGVRRADIIHGPCEEK